MDPYDVIAVQRERFAIRESVRAPIGTDSDPAAALAAGMDPALVASLYGMDNPASLLQERG